MSLLYPKMYASWARPHPLDARAERRPTTQQSLPYLPMIGPPPLRFEAAQPPPDLLTRPPAAGPPNVDRIPSEPIAPAPSAAPGQPATNLPDPPQTEPETPIAPATPEDRREPPIPAIIPDDTPTQTRHEDFLPYFRYPTGSGKTTFIMPVPTPPTDNTKQPPSSATYQQR